MSILSRPNLATISYYSVQYLIKRPIITVLVLLFTCLLLLLHQYDNKFDSPHGFEDTDRRNPREVDQETSTSGVILDIKSSQMKQLNDLELRIEDLKRIKSSVREELKEIEEEKLKLLKEKNGLTNKIDKLAQQISKSKTQLKQLELDISSDRRRKFEQNCDKNRLIPLVINPLKSIDIEKLSIQEDNQIKQDDRKNLVPKSRLKYSSSYSFNFSDCPLTREFKFYLAPAIANNSSNKFLDTTFESSIAIDILKTSSRLTSDIDEACIVVYVIDIISENIEDQLDINKNNLLINLTRQPLKLSHGVVASPVFSRNTFREKLDLVLPSVWQSASDYDSIVESIPPQSPLKRKYLASYFGLDQYHTGSQSNISTGMYSGLPHLNQLEKILQTIHRNSLDDLFLFIYNCGPNTDPQCYEEKEKMIELSTFLIIIPNMGYDAEENTSEMLYLAFSRGVIPIVIGEERVQLPFDNVIDWRKAAILLNSARLPELHFILRSINWADLYQLKYHGRRIFETYLATSRQVLETTISVLSMEIFKYPPPAVQDLLIGSYYDKKGPTLDINCTSSACIDTNFDSFNGLISSEILGPREAPLPSPTFTRNFSLVLNSAYDMWNNPFHSHLNLFPSLPIDPVSPSEFKFINPDQGYRPIGEGIGGSGVEFSQALGGDYANEQFTVVLLTYERKAILMKTLERLKGLAYLNKILVVWNGVQHQPSHDLVWPDVGVPIEVVRVTSNSLNNRFLPYDSIKTDAILSLDDDTPLRPDEIVFGFRVWRESRDRIVGFPGRFHAWQKEQNSWLYNSNHSCELSMVLTGGAFFHKYYSYIYTYKMPQTIRSLVDKFMNCEDIAMNFLVAHLTRKPPIKVTSRWTFHCPNCQSSLSENESHFRERHECLNTFASIYGYMPLMSTQHRSDSVLFKTRLPHDKQKCFRFV